MARLNDHLAFDRFFVGEECPEVHKETDRPWGNGNILAHLATHTPLYGLLVVYPKYGTKGFLSHVYHVAADMSPLQLRDIAEHLSKFGKED